MRYRSCVDWCPKKCKSGAHTGGRAEPLPHTSGKRVPITVAGFVVVKAGGLGANGRRETVKWRGRSGRQVG
jgi:hypothetical protein